MRKQTRIDDIKHKGKLHMHAKPENAMEYMESIMETLAHHIVNLWKFCGQSIIRYWYDAKFETDCKITKNER